MQSSNHKSLLESMVHQELEGRASRSSEDMGSSQRDLQISLQSFSESNTDAAQRAMGLSVVAWRDEASCLLVKIGHMLCRLALA